MDIHTIRTHQIVFSLLTIALLLSENTFAQDVYDSEEFEIRVVDEVTGEPVEGVLLLAVWPITPQHLYEKPPASLEEAALQLSEMRILKAAEALSDKEGWIRLAGWSAEIPESYTLTWYRRPEFVLFAEEYEDRQFTEFGKVDGGKHDYSHDSFYQKKLSDDQSESEGDGVPGGLMAPDGGFWNGKTIKLRKFSEGDRWREAGLISFFQWIFYEKAIDCPSVHIPQAMVAYSNLVWRNPNETVEDIVREMMGPTPCMSFEAFEEKYL